MRRLAITAVLLVVVAVSGGCGDDEESADGASTTTTVTTAAVIGEPLVVFDGTECGYTGPESIPAGIERFEFVNESPLPAVAVIFELEPGYSIEDHLAYGRPVGNDESAWPVWPNPQAIRFLTLRAAPGERAELSTGMAGGGVSIECSTLEALPAGAHIAWFTGPYLPPAG